MHNRIRARKLRARQRRMLLRGIRDNLHKGSMHRRDWQSILLRGRMYGWEDMSFEHEPPDLRHRGNWLYHRISHNDLLDRSGLRAPSAVRLFGSQLGRVAGAKHP